MKSYAGKLFNLLGKKKFLAIKINEICIKVKLYRTNYWFSPVSLRKRFK